MFEVSWCVGLYVTILLIEFLPVPFERWGLQKAMDIWKRRALGTIDLKTLNAKLRGHHQYYGRPTNFQCPWKFLSGTCRLLHH